MLISQRKGTWFKSVGYSEMFRKEVESICCLMSLSIPTPYLGRSPEFYLWNNSSPFGSNKVQAPGPKARANDPGQRQKHNSSSGYIDWFRDEHVT